MKRALFVTDPAHFNATTSGGVQICSQEYFRLLQSCQMDVQTFFVEHTRRFATRLKIRLGVELYERYDFSALFPQLKKVIEDGGFSVIALNQVALMGFAPLLRAAFGDTIRIVLLSHGNESGDFLHHVARREPSYGVAMIRDIYRLGSAVYRESRGFSGAVDVLLTISETDRQVGNWLGARRSVFVPRTFDHDFLPWSPDPNRVGFVASLDHKPNLDGITQVLDELEKLEYGSLRVRIVGAPREKGEALMRRSGLVEYAGPLSNVELRAEAATWSAFLNPVFWYARGASTKLAVAINWGLPIISTPAGNRGYVWREGGLCTVDSAAEMAAAVLRLTQDPALLQQAAAGVRDVAASGPAFPEIARQLQEYL